MNFRTTAILFCIVFVLVGALLYFALTQRDSDQEAEGPFSVFALNGIKADKIETVELIRTQPTEETLTLTRVSGRWTLSGSTPAKLDSTAVDNLVRELLAIKPAEYKESLDNLTTLELNPPSYIVKLKAGDKQAGMNVGYTTTGNEKAHTMVSSTDDAQRAFAVRTADIRSLFKDAVRNQKGSAHNLGKWLADFRQKRLLSIDPANPESQIQALQLSRGTQKVAFAQSGDEWTFVLPANFGAVDVAGDSQPSPGRYTGLRPMLNALGLIQTAGPEDYRENIPAAKFAEYGVDAENPAVVRVELKPKGQPAEVVYLGKPAAPGKVYARLDGDSAIVTVATDAVESLVTTITDPTPLRNRDLITEAKRSKIDAIDSTFNGGFNLRRVSVDKEPKWALYGTGTPVGATPPLVNRLLETLAKPRLALDTLTATNDAAFSEKRGELSIWFEAIEAKSDKGTLPAEAKPKGEPTVFTFGQVEPEFQYLRRTSAGKITDFKVPLNLVNDLSLTRLQLIDAKLGLFAAAQSKAVVLSRNGSRLEVTKLAAADPTYTRGGKWAFAWPEGLKGQVADGDTIANAIDVLTGLAGAKIVEENPTDERLKALGLDPAAPKLSVRLSGVEGAEKERDYHFGIEATDGATVYAHIIGKPYVFLADRKSVQVLSEADLSDKIIVRTDSSRFQTLYLKGWKATSKTGEAIGAVLENRNGIWTAKEPAGTLVDATKLKLFLTAIEAPRAVLKLADAADALPEPEYGFGDTSLSVIAELADKTVLNIRIGSETREKNGYYAQVNGKTYILDPKLLRTVVNQLPFTVK